MKVCPAGWHLPSAAELYELTATIGGEKTEGKHLKAKSGWNDNNGKSGNGLDTYGFAALPGGYGNSVGSFIVAGNFGLWWSSSEYDASFAHYRGMDYYGEHAYWNGSYKSYLFSVRCLRD